MNVFDLPVLSALLAACAAGLAALGTLVTPAGAIVLVTLAVRALLIPVGVSLARAEVARRRLAPRLAQLRTRWAKNPERLQRETLALYASEKVSPFAGILPVLAQAPVLTLVYATFTTQEVTGTLFGAPLGMHLTAALTPGTLVFAGLLIALAVVAFLARRASIRHAPPGTDTSLTRALSWAPFLTVVVAAFLPVAAALYLTVSSAWSLAERTLLRRVVIS